MKSAMITAIVLLLTTPVILSGCGSSQRKPTGKELFGIYLERGDCVNAVSTAKKNIMGVALYDILGNTYLTCHKDVHRAHAYFHAAATQGSDFSRKKLDELGLKKPMVRKVPIHPVKVGKY